MFFDKLFGWRPYSLTNIFLVPIIFWIIPTVFIYLRLNEETLAKEEAVDSLKDFKMWTQKQEYSVATILGEIRKTEENTEKVRNQVGLILQQMKDLTDRVDKFDDVATMVEEMWQENEDNPNDIIHKNDKLEEAEETHDHGDTIDEGILIEVDIPKFPKIVYDPQPPDAPGEYGSGIDIDKETLTEAERKEWEDGYNDYGYNSFISDKISLHRKLQDVRYDSCPREFRPDLPATSIIICFHNEAWSVLLRLVHSVLDSSPEHLIKEVILFDDYSDMPHLGKPLEYYMSRLEKVRIIRTKERVGSIRARSLAMTEALGPVLTVLDSHCECFSGWLEPLLDRVAADESVIVAPVINTIFMDNFAVDGNQLNDLGGIHLETLEFKWLPWNEKRRKPPVVHKSYKSPAIAGGLFSMTKDFFLQTGKYDEDMEIWGPDNVELSLRTWMCGGSLEVHPCSHVAHVFRARTPYTWGGDIGSILKKNHVRVAEVWLDDYKRFYYDKIGNDLGDYGDVSARKQLRKDLDCKSFQWYVDNVHPDIFMPPESVAAGEIWINKDGETRCLDAKQFDAGGLPAGAIGCHGLLGAQLWRLTEKEDIRMIDGCLDYDYGSESVVVLPCSDKKSQKWKLQEDHLIHQETGLCMGVKEMYSPDNLMLSQCDDIPDQIWKIGQRT